MMGGIAMRIPVEKWPQLNNVYWIIASEWSIERPDVIELESLSMSLPDVLRSCDGLITKPAYGMFVEAVCNNIPVIYVRRQDWPEESYLIEWLNTHGTGIEVSRSDFDSGRLEQALDVCCCEKQENRVAPYGIGESADILENLF